MVSAAAWSLFLFTVLQAYAAYALLAGGPRRDLPRGTLALLFAANAVLTFQALLDVVAGRAMVQPPWARALDAATNGMLVVAGEAIAAAALGRRFHPAAWAVAGIVVALPVASMVQAAPESSAWTLLGYAWFAARVTQVAWRAPEPGATWAWWLLIAFAARFVEFLGGYAPFPFSPSTALSERVLLLPILAALALACGGMVLLVAANPARPRSVALAVMLAAGILLAILRRPGSAFIAEPIIVYLSLGAFRPLGVLAALVGPGLLGATLAPGALVRHTAVAGAAGATFLAAMGVMPLALADASDERALLLSVAVTLVVLPVWALVVERAAAGMGAAAQPAPSAHHAPAPPALPPGLDPACRFGPADLAAYHQARRRVAALPAATRRALGALTRGQRILLALQGSSQATLGEAAYSQAGLQLATHVPYRHLSTAVAKLNETAAPARWVESSTGVRGIRYYWLTAAGRARGEQVAADLGLAGVPDLRSLVGEAFARDAASPGSSEPAVAATLAEPRSPVDSDAP